MKCGHTAQAYEQGTNKPVCIICMCDEVAETLPDLTGRVARCTYYGQGINNRSSGYKVCKGEVPSSFDLPFFEYRPDKPYDKYYDGCYGWD